MRWLLAIGLFLILSGPVGVFAHGPAPAALGVLGSLEEKGGQPSFIRMNIGLARYEAGRQYTYLCPSQWGGAPQPLAAASSDGTEVVVVASGRVFYSEDSGCSFEEKIIPEEYGNARDVVWGGSSGFVLVVGDAEGAVLSVGPLGWGEIGGFGERIGSAAMRPDSFSVFEDGERLLIGVAGARPSPGLFFAEIHQGEEGSAMWSLLPLPEALGEVQSLRVRSIEADGVLWLVSTHDDGLRLWRGSISGQGNAVEVHWVSLAGAFERVLGPVKSGDSNVVVLGDRAGRVEVQEQASLLSFDEDREVDWTCLMRWGDQLFICTLPTLYSVSADEESLASSSQLQPTFELSMLTSPETSCLSEEKADQCDSDWIHFGAEAGLFEAGTPTEKSSGCRVGSRPGPNHAPLGFWMAALVFWAVQRKRVLAL